MTEPLADLHRHLDGSLRLATLQELAESLGISLPEDLYFYAGMGLEEALACFAVTLSVLQQPAAVRRVASEICEDASASHVSTLEIRFAPQLHEAAPMPDIVDAALDGIQGRAGLILCALYGDAPKRVMELVDIAKHRPGVVGIDLAGGPNPGHDWAMSDYSEAFTRAKEIGLGRTVHAGEGRPAAEIRTAIEVLHAQRIGHGTTILEDPSVVELALEGGITLEACPSSNVHTGVISRVEDHPLATWLELGLKVCVCTDNTLFSRVTEIEEMANVANIPGVGEAQLKALVAHGHAARFER